VQPVGGPPEMQFGGDGHERFELTQLHKVKVPAPAFVFSAMARVSRERRSPAERSLFGRAEECVHELGLFRPWMRCHARSTVTAQRPR
jgi:hypothetical protein